MFTCPQKEGAVLGIFRHLRPPPIGLSGQNDAFFVQKCIQLVREKLTVFLYGQDIVGIYVSLAFRRYSQVRGRCWGLCEICKNVILISGADPIRSYSIKTCRVSRNKVSHLKVIPGRIT